MASNIGPVGIWTYGLSGDASDAAEVKGAGFDFPLARPG
jgi:hypothetical protein